MKCGLLPLSQESALIGDVSYHRYPRHIIFLSIPSKETYPRNHYDDSFDDDANDDVVNFHSDCFSYNGIVVDPNERDSLAKDLGPNNKVFHRV